MPRRNPLLQSHNTEGRLGTQPLSQAPKLQRSGEAVEVYDAPQSSHQKHLLLQSRPYPNTRSSRGRTNPVISARRRRPIRVSTPPPSVGNRVGRGRRTASRSRKNPSARVVSRSNPQESTRASQRRSEYQGRRAGGSDNRAASSAQTMATSVPGRVLRSVNYVRTTQQQHSSSPNVIQVSKPHAPSSLSQGMEGLFQDRTEGTVERPPVSVKEPSNFVPGRSSEATGAGIQNQLLNNTTERVIPCSNAGVLPTESQEIYTNGGQVETSPMAVSTLLCCPPPRSDAGVSPASMTQRVNNMATTLAPALGDLPISGIPSRFRSVIRGGEPRVYPVSMNRNMNHASTLLCQCSNTQLTGPICSQGMEPAEGRTERPVSISTPLAQVLPGGQYGENQVAVSQPLANMSTCEAAGTPQGFVAFPHTGNTRSLAPRSSYAAPEEYPVQGNLPGMMSGVDLAQQKELSRTRLMQGSRIQRPYQVSQALVEYAQRGRAVTPTVQVSPGVSNAVGTTVVVRGQACDGFGGPTTNTPIPPMPVNIVGVEALEAKAIHASKNSSPLPAISESTIDLPILPEMEELVQEDGKTAQECTNPPVVMETQRDVGVSERGQREGENFEAVEAMLQGGGDTTLPFNEEGLDMLHSFFTSPMETNEADGSATSPQCGLERVQEPTVKEQMSRIIGLDLKIMNKPDVEETNTAEDVEMQDPNSSERGSPVMSDDMERRLDNDAMDGVVTNPVDRAISDPVVPRPVDGKDVESVSVIDGAILHEAQPTEHSVSNLLKSHPKSVVKSFTTSDYGRLQKALRLHGAYNREELMKMFPERSYEELHQRIHYYFPGAVHQLGPEEHGRMFDIIGRAVDWEYVAGGMYGRDADEIRRYYYGLLSR